MAAPFPHNREQTDARQAQTFRSLESQVNAIRAAAITADLICEDACNPGQLGQEAARRLGMSDYTVLILTEEQFEALHYVVRRSRDEADLLRKAYYAGYGGQDVPCA